MPAEAGDRSHEQNLIERDLALRQRAIRERESRLEIARCENAHVHDPIAEARQRATDRCGDRIAERARGHVVPVAVFERVGRVLNARGHDMLAVGRQRRPAKGRHADLDMRLAGH